MAKFNLGAFFYHLQVYMWIMQPQAKKHPSHFTSSVFN